MVRESFPAPNPKDSPRQGRLTMRNTILEDARQLSSGTIAGLIGSTRYEDIDREQTAFVAFVANRSGRFETWQDAWEAFRGWREIVA